MNRFTLGSVVLVLSAVTTSAQTVLPQATDSYFTTAQKQLQDHLQQTPKTGRAKNVILFVGDGMGISSVTAGRILEGQLRGVDGESNTLSFERFPYSAFSKTYTHDAQVADSAPTASAMVTGVKLRNDVIGLNADAMPSDCAGSKGKQVMSVAAMAELSGSSVGIVTTARLTHATPAAIYAHTPNRDWESDVEVPKADRDAGCTDIASQLIDWPYGDGVEVALGGGRDRFSLQTATDPEGQKFSKPREKRDLIQEWLTRFSNSGAYVWNKAQFDAIDPKVTQHLLGLFEVNHMQFEADRVKGGAPNEPSLAEMTSKAIDMLSSNQKGYFLLVEGGRIDHGHHDGNAYRALHDVVALDAAVKTALSKVDLNETLIIVTADHSHVFVIAGYPKRGNPIFETVTDPSGKLTLATDGKPYTTLGYLNGPGATVMGRPHPKQAAPLTPTDPDYKQQAAVPLGSETHGGEDVGIFATGPWAHLFSGVVEQNYIYHVIDHATGWSQKLGLKKSP
jgi:alkaline phosphatase